MRVDVVIPTVSKDFIMLDHVIRSLKHIKHNVNKVYVVAPRDVLVEKYCLRKKIVFIDENTVLGFDKKHITYSVGGVDRSGWLFQQLLKLSGDKFVEMQNFIVLDSDTVYVNDICFKKKCRFVFYGSDEFHKPYYDAYEYMFGYPPVARVSLVAHMMIFNSDYLKEMKDELEARWNRPWFDVVISTSSSAEQSCVSEYETYSNWVIFHYPEKYIIYPFYNKGQVRICPDDFLCLAASVEYLHSVSFHAYLRN